MIKLHASPLMTMELNKNVMYPLVFMMQAYIIIRCRTVVETHFCWPTLLPSWLVFMMRGLYFVSHREQRWHQHVFWMKTLVIARATCVLSHAFEKEHRDWRIKDASCSVYPWVRSRRYGRSRDETKYRCRPCGRNTLLLAYFFALLLRTFWHG